MVLIQIQDKGVDSVDNKDMNSTKELKYPTCGRIGNPDVPHVFTYFRELLPTAQNGTQQID